MYVCMCDTVTAFSTFIYLFQFFSPNSVLVYVYIFIFMHLYSFKICSISVHWIGSKWFLIMCIIILCDGLTQAAIFFILYPYTWCRHTLWSLLTSIRSKVFVFVRSSDFMDFFDRCYCLFDYVSSIRFNAVFIFHRCICLSFFYRKETFL